MADLKESALTAQSDCKWVRALDANGNSIRISKEDLAEVLGGLIGTATSDKAGLMSSEDKRRVTRMIAMRQRWGYTGYLRLVLLNKKTLTPASFFINYSSTFDVVTIVYDGEFSIKTSFSKISKGLFGYVMEGGVPIVYLKLNPGTNLGMLVLSGGDNTKDFLDHVETEPKGIVWFS